MAKRDISLVDLNPNLCLIFACDSAGGIGPKEGDALKIPGQIVGRFISRVALMESMAVGAKPINMINTLAVEYNPTGKDIITGIKEEVKEAGLTLDIINGSTEENFKTIQTGIGVMVTGICKRSKLKLATSQINDLVLAIGLPMVGVEVLEYEKDIADLKLLLSLLKLDYIHEILPVGSKGIAYEANLLAKMSGLSIKFKQDIDLDLTKSAGPGTTLLVSLTEIDFMKLDKMIKKPLNLIGKLVS